MPYGLCRRGSTGWYGRIATTAGSSLYNIPNIIHIIIKVRSWSAEGGWSGDYQVKVRWILGEFQFQVKFKNPQSKLGDGPVRSDDDQVVKVSWQSGEGQVSSIFWAWHGWTWNLFMLNFKEGLGNFVRWVEVNACIWCNWSWDFSSHYDSHVTVTGVEHPELGPDLDKEIFTTLYWAASPSVSIVMIIIYVINLDPEPGAKCCYNKFTGCNCDDPGVIYLHIFSPHS